ncbi:MAG: type III-A CRISPR-associated RAMP protein Csm5 [bacterium]
MKIKLKVKTPTFIGSGDSISPTLDFVFERDQVILLDIDKLTDWLYKSNQEITLVKDLAHLVSRREGNIERFLRDYKLNIADFKRTSLRLAFQTSGRDMSQIFKKIDMPITNSLGAYIPGSTIKGLIRSAFIFQFIKDNGGWKRVKTQTYIRENYQGRNRSYIGEDIFRKELDKIYTEALRFIQVTDSSCLPLEKLQVFLLERITRTNKPIPKLIIGLPQNTELYLEIKILPGFKKAEIPEYWKSLFEEETKLINVLQYYTFTLMEQERMLIEKLPNSRRGLLVTFYAKYIEEQTRAIKNREKKSLVRIGFGKTYYFNSIGYFFTDEEKRIFRIGGNRALSNSLFPSSRWIVENSQGEKEMPGFCSVEIL